jgi:hypothetical protein
MGESRFRRGRRAFRRWRRARPFWGGVFTLLSGLEFYLTVHADPLSFSLSFGQQGFLAWLLPLVLVLCGFLGWFTPQRVFYGVVAAVTAVYGLIGLNLGGFLVGTVLGIVGGGLLASWTPTDPAGQLAGPPGGQDLPQTRRPPVAETGTDPGVPGLPRAAGAPDSSGAEGRSEGQASFPVAPQEDLGDLSSEFLAPQGVAGSQTTTGGGTEAGGVAAVRQLGELNENVAAAVDGARDGRIRKVQGHLRLGGTDALALVLAVAVAGGSTLLVVPPSTAQVASVPRAAPAKPAAVSCVEVPRTSADAGAKVTAKATKTAKTTAKATETAKTTAKATETAKTTKAAMPSTPPTRTPSTAATPSARSALATKTPSTAATPSALSTRTPSTAATQSALATRTASTAATQSARSALSTRTPSTAATPSARSASPTDPPSALSTAASAKVPSAGTRTPAATTPTAGSPATASASASTRPVNCSGALSARALTAAAAAMPAVSGVSDLTTDSLVMHGLSYDGVVDLQKVDGSTIRVLRFSMSSVSHTPFRLDTSDRTGNQHFTADVLTVSGEVSVYCTSLSGKLLGLIPLTFTPDSPPLLILPDLSLASVTIGLVDVQAQRLDASSFAVVPG